LRKFIYYFPYNKLRTLEARPKAIERTFRICSLYYKQQMYKKETNERVKNILSAERKAKCYACKCSKAGDTI
jgi:hypothetical protein